MTLDEFIKNKRQILDNFKKDWIARNKLNPDDFPIEIVEDSEYYAQREWDSQFEAYVSLRI